MASRTSRAVWHLLAVCVLSGMAGPIRADQPARPRPASPAIPLDRLSPQDRLRVGAVIEKPTLATRSAPEIFRGSVPLYEHFLDHPDQAVKTWRRLGAKCTDIVDRGNGWFTWRDGQGSEVNWQTVLREEGIRVWYARGNVKPGLLLPDVPVRAVAVLRYAEGSDENGAPVLRHQVELFFHTDSKTAALIAKLIGPAAPRIAEQCAGQLGLFFSALVWYLDRHPEQAVALLWGLAADTSR